MKYKAVLFDLDGTLLNTLPDLAYITNRTLREYGLPEHTEDDVRMYVGNGVRLLFERALPKDRVFTEEEVETMYRTMRENYVAYQNRLSVKYEGIDRVLTVLRENGVKIGIVSNKPDDATQGVVKRYFEGQIDFAVGQREGVPVKPAPDVTKSAREARGVRAEDCVYVGDSDTDIETGHMAGMPSIGASWGFRGREFLEEHGADMIADTPEELLPLLF